MPGPMSPDEYGEGSNDEELEEAGYAVGLDVWEPLETAYTGFLDGDNALANSQLWSLRQAIRAELFDELGHPGFEPEP